MTAGFTPGDAISNFMLSCGRILRQWGVRVNFYADHIASPYETIAQHSRFYPANGSDLLWFHYSIYSDNAEIATTSPDFKIMDFHGISPPHLFTGQNPHLATLCQQGIDLLPTLKDTFDAFVVHSSYTRDQLINLGYAASKIHQIALCVDTANFEQAKDFPLAEQLAQLNYLLFVGRIVPQKDIMAMLRIFEQIHQFKPDMVLILVGSREQTRAYQQQINKFIQQHHLQNHVLFTGQVNNHSLLATLFAQAQLYLVTSEWESFCVPIVESLYFGVPAAVANTPPLPEVVGPAGIVIDKTEPQAAAAQILALLANGKQYKQLSETAVNWVKQYTDQALAANMQALLIDQLGIDPAFCVP